MLATDVGSHDGVASLSGANERCKGGLPLLPLDNRGDIFSLLFNHLSGFLSCFASSLLNVVVNWGLSVPASGWLAAWLDLQQALLSLLNDLGRG